MKAPGAGGDGAVVDAAYTLNGIAAQWTGARQKVWLPVLDTDAARAFTLASPVHEDFFRSVGADSAIFDDEIICR